MSNEKHDVSHDEVDLESNGGLKRSMTAVTLTPQQFEALYLQPQQAAGRSRLIGRVGNAAPLWGYMFSFFLSANVIL
jgi:hypothetical protein